ncbi:UDP-N-acetylmuramate dehydrogenase [Gudongella sp. DL1XJH-153]|uniref:UDP-N-acetylmuramate dehydrogenase n=1 Tax=Gudongella sp. DL1XJH-153 TaxID=3409804 RepID=UPI003BB5046F
MKNYKEYFSERNFSDIRYNEPLKNHTSFKVGGPADVMVIPTSEEELIDAVKICRDNDLKYFIMGNGSNLLIKDTGIRGVVIRINEGFDTVVVKDAKIVANAGALLTAVSKIALRESLEGMEFASGIPGTIGGAITMNAGAYGGEMKDVVSSVRVLTKDNQILDLTNDEMDFAYRNSKVKELDLIVISVEIDLSHGDFDTIDEKIKELTFQRTSKQPLELPSGGSTFKRPEGYFAGKLIDDAGLRGLRHGDAQVSEKHCGFVVNRGNTSYKEIMELVGVIQKTVMDKFGVELEMEIKRVGDD